MPGQRSMGLALVAGAGLLAVVAAVAFMGSSSKGKSDRSTSEKKEEPKSSTKGETVSASRSLNLSDAPQTSVKTADSQTKPLVQETTVSSKSKAMESDAAAKLEVSKDVVATSASKEQNDSVDAKASEMAAKVNIDASKSPKVNELKQKFEQKLPKIPVPVAPVTITKVKSPSVNANKAESKEQPEKVPAPSEPKEKVAHQSEKAETGPNPVEAPPAETETVKTPAKDPIVAEELKKENEENAASNEPEGRSNAIEPSATVKSEPTPVAAQEEEEEAKEPSPVQEEEKAASTSPASSHSSPVVVEASPESEQAGDKEPLGDGTWVTVDAAKADDEKNQTAPVQEAGEAATSVADVSSEEPKAPVVTPTKPSTSKKRRNNKKKNKGKGKRKK